MTNSYFTDADTVDESFDEAVSGLLDLDRRPFHLDIEFYDQEDLSCTIHHHAWVWDVFDVCELRPDLSYREAWEVLKLAGEDDHDEAGTCRDVIRSYARELFGEPPNFHQYHGDPIAVDSTAMME